MTPPVRIDLHVHSVHSVDGRATVEEIVARVEARSLGGFALTDHNSTVGHAALREAAATHPDLLLIPGVEVSTREGHLLAYGIAEAPPAHAGILETSEWVRAHGGVAVLPHPFRRPHGSGFHLPPGTRLAAVEAVNGHNTVRANARGAALADRLSLPTTGGSDAHRLDEVGTAYTQLPDGCQSVDAFLAALERREVEGAGTSLGRLAWLRWGWRSGVARLGRGFRSV